MLDHAYVCDCVGCSQHVPQLSMQPWPCQQAPIRCPVYALSTRLMHPSDSRSSQHRLLHTPPASPRSGGPAWMLLPGDVQSCGCRYLPRQRSCTVNMGAYKRSKRSPRTKVGQKAQQRAKVCITCPASAFTPCSRHDCERACRVGQYRVAEVDVR